MVVFVRDFLEMSQSVNLHKPRLNKRTLNWKKQKRRGPDAAVVPRGSQMDCIRKRATVGLEAETELTTKLHYDDVVCEKQIGEGSFGVV